MKNDSIKYKDKPAIVCFAGSDWWYQNRGLFSPQILWRLAKYYKVLYVNSLGIRVPSLRQDRYAAKKMTHKFRSIVRFLRKTDNGMYVFTPISIPLFGRPLVGNIVSVFTLLQVKLVMRLLSFKNPIFYIACPTGWEVVKKLSPRYLIYQRTDIIEEMPGINKSYIVSLNDTLTRVADLVLCVNTGLWQEGLKKNPNCILVGHGVDFDKFANADKSEYIPEDIAIVPKPIIGFFGKIADDVCDFQLIEYMAKALPDMSIVLVGPVSSDVGDLKKYKNIFFLGRKPYEEIPHYGKVFDVAIMPWKKNKWIEFCDPVKTKEYLALGKPIVSIEYPELKRYKNITCAVTNYDQFINCIRTAIEECDLNLKLKRQESVRNETWDDKIKVIIDFIEKL